MNKLITILCLLLGLQAFAQKQPAQINEVLSPENFQAAMLKNNGTLIDVRTPGEFKKGYIKGARLMNIFDDNFETELKKLDKNATYYVYCASGGRSSECAETMKKLGFKRVYDLDGGITRWQKVGLPVTTP